MGGARTRTAVAVHVACTEELTAGYGTRVGVRTPNMPSMSVTLDVSKLSGWLNAYANCRVELHRGTWRARGAGRREDRGSVTVHAACTAKPTQHWAQHGRGGAHLKHLAHDRDAGRDEAQRLVERPRFLPRRTACRCEGGCCEGACRAWRCGGARSMHGGTDWTLRTARAARGCARRT